MSTKVNANPTKEFFISMLTRDIDIKAAIMELIDNSIDGAKRLRPDGDFSGLYIHISYNKDSFQIADNCGGMNIQTATQYAFRFGRPQHRPAEETEQQFTGVFGIGMKRSLFRIGRRFKIVSTTETEQFSLDVDVDEWLKDTAPDWSFALTEEKTGLDNDKNNTGTCITVTKLYDGISNQFQLSYFSNTLTNYIERYRTLAVESGMEILINGHPIIFTEEQIIQSENVIPYRYSIKNGPVTINIIAGIAPKGNPEKAGWHIYCNGRLVVYADKTTLTGWGEDGLRQYHPSLAFFRGFVFFESTKQEELPWNTSKTSVDTSSKYYICALVKMREATQRIIDECRALADGDFEETTEESIFSKNALLKLNSSTIANLVNETRTFELKVPEVKEVIKMTSISFKKPSEIVDVVKKQMGAKSNKDVGSRAFDYYLRKECEYDG